MYDYEALSGDSVYHVGQPSFASATHLQKHHLFLLELNCHTISWKFNHPKEAVLTKLGRRLAGSLRASRLTP